MTSSAYYRQSPTVRNRCVTPMTPDVIQRLAPVTDRSLAVRMSRTHTPASGRAATARGEFGDMSHLISPIIGSFGGNASGNNSDVRNATMYYNPARQQIYKRYSIKDWDSSNSMNYNLSDKERSAAEKLRMDAWRTVKLTEQKTKVRQSDVTKKLNERVNDITFWKSQLQDELSLQEKEQENLREHLRILEMALANTERPLQISEECLIQREKRRGIDLVKDDVENSLIKEVKIIRLCQDRMKKGIERAKVQLKMNRAAQHELDKDAKDKNHAQNLDDRMYQLKNSSQDIAMFPGVEGIDHTISNPNSWVRFTQENIARSQKCRSASEKLRGDIDSMLRSCANEMWSQFNSVNNTLNSRVHDVTDTRNKLQAHLNRTTQEIMDVEKTIHLLKKAIADKEAPLKVAQTRLQERTGRMNVELCNDPSMKTLQVEVHEIRSSIQHLQEQLQIAEATHARLSKARNILETDINVKENSLSIDDKVCLGMRKTFPMEPKHGPLLGMPLTY